MSVGCVPSYGCGGASSVGMVLVLFILLVIILSYWGLGY